MNSNYYTDNEKSWGLEFGQNLQSKIQATNVTQHKLAKEVGTTEAVISRYIHGVSIPSVYRVCQIANILGCEVGELVKTSYRND